MFNRLVARSRSRSILVGAAMATALTVLSTAFAGASTVGTLDALVDQAGAGMVVARGAETVYSHDGGTGVDQVVPLASGSKLVAATTMMALVDQGLLALDTPVAMYLRNSPVSWPQNKNAITLRMLLSHTAGIPENRCISGAATLLDCARDIASAPLNDIPGTAFSYGGTGYQLAGYLAEHVTGQRWQELVRRYVAAPAEMPTLAFDTSANPRIAGGAKASARDYLHLLQAHLADGVYRGAQLLSADSVREMRVNAVAGAAVRVSPGRRHHLDGYGLAWWIREPCARPGSDGPELSDPGAFGFIGLIDPSLGQATVITMRQNLEVGENLYRQARPHILALLTGSAPAHPTCGI
ncbi:serine hydrolase [Lentzea sp. HUAS12]|uniref:serine hydrolase domain-containing protein n=1 Tax=Lentzea sp. HUAS12 TaxID=2951806 RepID=UPI0020A1D354|nr:serine hydrolase domain-containing protein [Lentzea sp. HUAS12]USX56383.1 beta-lactamase family protein [Lentzea sp. HUAS12]